MKKIIPFLVLFCIMMLGTFALVQYTGAPSIPYILFGIVNWNNQNLGGARIEITNQNTGYSTIINTNRDGYWQEEGSNWLTTSSARPPILFGDVIKIKTLDGCGTNDICEKTFSAFSSGFEIFAREDLSVTGVLVITIITPPSSSGGSSGSSGGGGGGGGGSVPAWDCEAWTSCSNGQQTRICRQEQFTRKEKQECVLPEPTIISPVEPIIIVPPVEPTQPKIPEQYVCSDGTKVDIKENCPIPTKEHEQVVVDKLKELKIGGGISAVIIALIIGLYLWRRRKGKFATAEKGAKTFIDKRTK